MGKHARTFVLLLSSFLIFSHCPDDEDDALMLHLYHKYQKDIERATLGTQISPAYLAALISLESHPPGNPESERFEPAIYERLKELKYTAKPYGSLSRKVMLNLTDAELRKLATSYGLTQIMGFHCLDLGCSVDELKGNYHLQWAVVWMMKNYRDAARRNDWESCFRIHNTGHPSGTTSRKDYVSIGLKRMKYYEGWLERKGKML
jgi:hypothetical protein